MNERGRGVMKEREGNKKEEKRRNKVKKGEGAEEETEKDM